MTIIPSPSSIEIGLITAQRNAYQLFNEVESRLLLTPGKREKEVNQEIYDLAYEMFGIRKYWHKRIVRAGKNTLLPYRENPPDLIIQPDDMVIFDFGPIFEAWEADLGRSYVVGDNPLKRRLASNTAEAFERGKRYFESNPDCTGRDLYHYVSELAHEYGWSFGDPHAGHLIGEFPHESIQGDEVNNYICADNEERMRDTDKNGRVRHWILEIFFVDREQQVGAFFEQLLTLSPERDGYRLVEENDDQEPTRIAG
jgi:Xaa-Pro aminopeptidase